MKKNRNCTRRHIFLSYTRKREREKEKEKEREAEGVRDRDSSAGRETGGKSNAPDSLIELKTNSN